MMKRRDALKTLGGLAAGAGMAKFLPGCGGKDDGGGPVGITTYVYMMMENRSYDHWFGARSMLESKGGDGLLATMTQKDLDGKDVAVFEPSVHQLCALDPPHGWDANHASFNGGKNDQFLIQHQMDHSNNTAAIEPMQYLTRKDLPVSYALADAYTTCDRYFCSVMGPTWPNRFFWHSGDSGGAISNEIPAQGLNWPSIYHRLNAKGVDWAYYYGTIAVLSLVKDIDGDGRIKPFREFATDAAAGKLPPVVYIDPAFDFNDDHPPVHPINGQDLITSVYTALAASPQWKNIHLVITYDEHGGFFDHVAPPKIMGDARAAQGFDQLGFRVPTMAIGPYAKQGYVSHAQMEHCSALRHLELAFDLEPCNQRTAMASDLSDTIDMDRLARGEPADPIELPVIDEAMFPQGAACKSSNPAREAPEPHVIHQTADLYPEIFAKYDRRGEIDEYAASIRSYLAANRRTRRR